MNGVFTFLAELAKLKHLGWGYYNSGKEGSSATHETIRNKVVKLKQPKDISDYTSAKSSFNTKRTSSAVHPLVQKLRAAKEAHKAAIATYNHINKLNPSSHEDYTGSGLLHAITKIKKLQFHTQQGSVGYLGPTGSRKVTHFYDGPKNKLHTLTPSVSKKLSAHVDQLKNDKAWSTPGKHHPVTHFDHLYKQAQNDLHKKEDQVSNLKLKSWKKNLTGDRASAAIKHYTGTAKGMSNVHPDLKKSVKNYTGEDFTDINDKLVNPKVKNTYMSPQKIDQHVKHIDKAIGSNPAKGHLTVYRGVSDHLIKKMGLHNPKTTHFASPAYMSTSLSPDTATNFGSHLLITRVPKGHPALYAEPHSYHKGEREVLIPRGATHKVVKVSKRPNGKYRIETELQHPSIKGK